MAGWLHRVFVGDWLFVFPLCGFSLSLFCNYHSNEPAFANRAHMHKISDTGENRATVISALRNGVPMLNWPTDSRHH